MSTDRSILNRTSRLALQTPLQIALAAVMTLGLASSAKAQSFYDTQQSAAPSPYGAPVYRAESQQAAEPSRPRRLLNYNERQATPQPRRSSAGTASQTRPKIAITRTAPEGQPYQPAAAYSFDSAAPAHARSVQSEQQWTGTEIKVEDAAPNREQVAKAQENLEQLGYSPGPVDGILGRRTEDALREFQKAQAISEEAILGPLTRRALRSAIGETGSTIIEKTVIGKLMNYEKGKVPTAVVPSGATPAENDSPAPAGGSPPPDASTDR